MSAGAVSAAVAILLAASPSAGLAEHAPAEGSLTVSGSHTFHHRETPNDTGDCTSGRLSVLPEVFQADYGKWRLGLAVPRLTALSNVNLATTHDVEITAFTYFSPKQAASYWGSGHPPAPVKSLEVDGASGHITTTKGDLTGTVTATLKPLSRFGAPASGTLHIHATWDCSSVSR